MKFYDTIEQYSDKNITIYVDMDGVIAEYDIGNFDYNTIRPLKSNIKRIEELLKKGIKKRYKSANLIFYYLCNRLYGDEGITENFIQNCEKYDMSKVLSKLSIETLICKLVLKVNLCHYR